MALYSMKVQADATQTRTQHWLTRMDWIGFSCKWFFDALTNIHKLIYFQWNNGVQVSISRNDVVTSKYVVMQTIAGLQEYPKRQQLKSFIGFEWSSTLYRADLRMLDLRIYLERLKPVHPGACPLSQLNQIFTCKRDRFCYVIHMESSDQRCYYTSMKDVRT